MPENTENDRLTPEEQSAVEGLATGYRRIREELGKIIVGQTAVIDELLIGLLARGHCMLEGVPGLAKTLLVSSLSRTLSLSFSRIQFTPDLMPSDITGTEIIEEDKGTGTRQLRFVKGPVFANVILADEINRTPPKTQAALLEAMQENQVTAAGFTHKLPRPFFVLATQNPIEQEGTYPLPEAQLDRFMLKILVGYPSEEEELAIVRLTTAHSETALQRVLDATQVHTLQELVRKVPCADHVMRFALRLARMTRPDSSNAPRYVKDYIAWGAGPRASQFLVLAAKARALIAGRYHVATDDIAGLAHPILRHRIVTNFNAEADGISPDKIIDRLLNDVSRADTPGLDAVGADAILSG